MIYHLSYIEKINLLINYKFLSTFYTLYQRLFFDRKKELFIIIEQNKYTISDQIQAWVLKFSAKYASLIIDHIVVRFCKKKTVIYFLNYFQDNCLFCINFYQSINILKELAKSLICYFISE